MKKNQLLSVNNFLVPSVNYSKYLDRPLLKINCCHSVTSHSEAADQGPISLGDAGISTALIFEEQVNSTMSSLSDQNV